MDLEAPLVSGLEHTLELGLVHVYLTLTCMISICRPWNVVLPTVVETTVRTLYSAKRVESLQPKRAKRVKSLVSKLAKRVESLESKRAKRV